jgi:endoglycosylceramidase
MMLRRPTLALTSTALLSVLVSCGGSGGAGERGDIRPGFTRTHTPMPTATPTLTEPPSASPTATPTAADTATAAAIASPTSTATATLPATPTETPSASPTQTSSATPPSTATASPTATPTENAVRLPALHGDPDPINGGRIADAEGRHVLLRGVNVNALAEYWQGGPFPTVFPLTEADADLMASIGWNAVRLLLSWSRVEPQPGVYDAAYLEEVRAAVKVLASRGLYSIIDLHQDAWSATLAARPDENCAANFQPALGWDGAPAWATLDGGMPRCAAAGVRELSLAVGTAFANFWADAAGPGDVGIRARYVTMLAHVAHALSPEPGVAGYDLMNEPNAFGIQPQIAMSMMYGEALAAIRQAERDAGSAPHLVLFEPSAIWSSFGNGAPPDFARAGDRDLVYAPHIYSGGFDGGPITAAAFAVAGDEAKGFGGAPVLSGEWGADPHRASDPSDPYFLDHQNLQDQFFYGATLWTWHESCGDPHKQADFRAGRVPYVWGEFDVDCTSNTITGVRQDLVDQLTRAYVRAAPGRLLETRYEFATGAFSAQGTGAAPGSELLVFYPAARDGTPSLATAGLADLRLLPAPGENVYIVARATGGDWSVSTE